jgi:hypothetical protein
MSILKKLFGKPSIEQEIQTGNGKEPEHAVMVYFDYKKEDLKPLHELEKKLEKVITDNKAGEYDGHEISVDYSDGILYMYGPNAEVLFKTIKQTLEATDFIVGAKAKLRFGPPQDGVKEIEVQVGLD